MKKLVVLVILTIMALNVQWHYDRMCAMVFSPRAHLTLQGVMCETVLGDKPLTDLLERHERVQKQVECKIANPDKEFVCDPRWTPPSKKKDL